MVNYCAGVKRAFWVPTTKSPENEPLTFIQFFSPVFLFKGKVSYFAGLFKTDAPFILLFYLASSFLL